MRGNFEITTALQYENRELKRKLAGYESGEEYRRIEEKYDRECAALLREKAALKAENASLRREHRHMTRKWFEVFEDIEAAYRKELAAKDREIARLKMEKLASDRTAEAERGKRREKQRELYAVQTKLEEAEGLIKKLTA